MAERFLTREVGHVEVFGREGGGFPVSMLNVSKTGAFFEAVRAEALPKAGDLVQVTLHLNQLGKSRSLHGEVVWTKNLGFGVKFLSKSMVWDKVLSRSLPS
ncbi:MAG: PilZ domain-containing protein [Bdellovibrionaceae bacterium]|nr:PilZ domain-containing protein [Pseudobdellovibrionaceae bacterium]